MARAGELTRLASLLGEACSEVEDTRLSVAHGLLRLPPDHPIAAAIRVVLKGAEGQEPPPPSLSDTWSASLSAFLDPDPFLLRPSDAGMGPGLDKLLGGGFSVGQTAAIVSLGAGVGKTSFVHQFADGVAEWSAESYVRALERGEIPVVVPVVFVSEMNTRDLSIRSLARQADVEGYLLRDPRGERGCRPLAEGLTEGETALQHAAAVAKSFDAAACFMTPVDRRTRVTVSMVEVIVERIRSHWEAEGCSVPAVLVIVDPLHRLLDPTRPEVEALGETLQQLLDLAQRAHAIVLFSSDTTKAAASGRNEAGGVKRGVELAHSVEMAFRGNYQLLHMPDVALGLITLRENDEHLPPEDATRLQREPAGTMYAEIVNAKARWDMPGRRAAYFLDPAMFRFRPTTSRNLPKERPLVDRIVEFIEGSPRCSENAVRKGVEGRDRAIRETIQQLLREDILRDHGTGTTGRRLQIAGTPHGTRAEQPRNNLTAQGEGQGVVPRGSSYGREPPRGTTSSAALRIEQEATQGELGELGDELRGATQ